MSNLVFKLIQAHHKSQPEPYTFSDVDWQKIVLTMCLLHQLNAISWKVETVTFRFIENPDSASKDANTLSLDFIPEIQTHAPKRWVMWDSRKLRCSVTEIIAQSLVLLPKDSVDSSWQFCDPRQTVLFGKWTGQQMKTLRVNRELRILWRKKKIKPLFKEPQ